MGKLSAGILTGVLGWSASHGVWADDFPPGSSSRRIEPSRLNVNHEARPLSGASSSSNAWRLRWRDPGAGESGVGESGAESSRPLASGVSRTRLVWTDSPKAATPAVRQVVQLAPADPFEDPFGDRAGQSGRDRRGTGALGTREILQPGMATERPAAPSLGDEPPPGSPLLDDAAPVPPATIPPNAAVLPTQQPNGFALPSENEPPCDRIYNRRNCCQEDDKCARAREFVLTDKITKISLDITPPFTNTDPNIPTDVKMTQTLAEAGSRIWKDRQGKQLAEGEMVDYRHGRVHVETRQGEIVRLPFNTLSDDDLCFVTAWWSLPDECLLGDERYNARNWLAMNMHWKASALCHKPLYFEEVALERYGHTTGPISQPAISMAHFFGSLALLPYQMGISPPQECEYTLGYYRPGNCAPWLVPAFPISLRGALLEAGIVVGGVYIIP